MFRITRLAFVAGLMTVALSLVILCGSTFAQPKPKLRPLHIALANNSVTMTAIYVAKQLGIFRKLRLRRSGIGFGTTRRIGRVARG